MLNCFKRECSCRFVSHTCSLAGIALSVDKNFRLVRGSYPYVLRQLLYSDDDDRTPAALEKLLIRLLTVDGKGEEIEWETLRDFLRLASTASKTYVPSSGKETDDKTLLSRQTIELFGQFLTSRTGLFLKKPLVHELAEAIDGMASIGEANLLRLSRGFLPVLPGMNGPVNERRMEEIRIMIATIQEALDKGSSGSPRMETIMEIIREVSAFLSDVRERRQDTAPLLEELQSVIQMVAVEVLEIRAHRAIRSLVRA